MERGDTSMQCPCCSASLPADTMTCPACGTDLGLFLTVQTLQLDLQRAREHTAETATQLDHVQAQLANLTTLLQTSLARQRPTVVTAATPATETARADLATPPALPVNDLPAAGAPPSGLSEGAELRFGQK